jgi:predicted RNA-binding protein with PIN domain
LDARRNELLRELTGYRKVRKHDITIVFDGHGGFSAEETESVTGGVRVIFSRIARTADDVIKDLIQKKKGAFIVVSSDRDVADFAWSHGSVPVRSEDFSFKLEKALKERHSPIPEDGDADEFNVDSFKRKGSARRLSKKQKAIARALNKL